VGAYGRSALGRTHHEKTIVKECFRENMREIVKYFNKISMKKKVIRHATDDRICCRIIGSIIGRTRWRNLTE
jgi:hypothetical protein